MVTKTLLALAAGAIMAFGAAGTSQAQSLSFDSMTQPSASLIYVADGLWTRLVSWSRAAPVTALAVAPIPGAIMHRVMDRPRTTGTPATIWGAVARGAG